MPLHVELVSADRLVWSGDASMVVARTTDGEIGVLTGHSPVLGLLVGGEVRITPVDGPAVTAAASWSSTADSAIRKRRRCFRPSPTMRRSYE